MNDADRRSAARMALQELTLADPTVRANMFRHIGALRLLLTGKLNDSPELKLIPAAGFDLDDLAVERLSKLSRSDGNDRLWITFDVDDASGPLTRIAVFHGSVDKDRVYYGNCQLWLPPDGSSISLVSDPHDRSVRLEPRRGGALRRRSSPAINALEPGRKRADARLRRILDSPEVRDVTMRRPVRVQLD